MRIALQPSSNTIAQQHYIDTIQNKVRLESIKEYLNENEYKELKLLYPNEMLMIWGVTPTNESKWDKLEEGRSVSLFYKNKKFFSQALITKKLHNEKLAKHLWDVDEKGNTWEYIYFLDKVSPLDLDIEVFNRTVGYAENYVLQGFNVLEGEKAEALYSNIDEFDSYDSDVDDSEDEYIEIVNKQFDGELESETKGVVRKEQGYLRNRMFKKNKTAKCSLCHNDFPVEMLVAGHIKKRSKCTREEKLDVDNIAMPVCKFGCDELFERGYIRVNEDGGVFSTNEYNATDFLWKYILRVMENKCLSHNNLTEKYFKWHRDYHESAWIKK